MVVKSCVDYNCETCNYTTSNLFNFNKHCSTRKHIKSTEPQQKVAYSCEKCNITYKERTGLWRHMKKCSQQSFEPVTDEPSVENTFVQAPAEPIDHAVLFEILKQNQEFRELMLEQNNKIFEQNEKLVEQNEKIIELSGKIGNTTNNNIKKQNNNFNLNFFLNETCKNAISLDDFVESLQINTQTAEYVGKHGFINGITNIFMNGLKELDVHMRPIHCTDAKRETMYVKGIEWEKDDETNPKMKAAITDVSNKNLKQYPIWIEENPDSKIVGTDKYEEQLKIMMGMLDVRTNKEQIIKNIAKQVVIDKNA
jgi:hypothetical protein